ncbi:MAG: CDP-alcohol phosphatidyltransferase family protein [Streptosporangiales bacterium]|nr:CDP-alcohol phosphatidyltransferase family protein [Streptosporangiales bacterium]
MDSRGSAGQDAYPTRLLTVPNGLSVARLAGVPLFLWLVLGPKADLWALGVLAASGFTDWLDGKLARAWNQASQVGKLLDPAADRLYIVAILAGLTLREIIPWWFAALLVARELLLAIALAALYLHRYEPLQVHFLGKAATMCLLYAFPLLFLGGQEGTLAEIANITGWGFALWGTGLYWCAAVLYVLQVGQLVSAARRGPAAEATETDAERSSSVTPEHEGRPA